MSIICPLGKINDLSNCQSWTITLHCGLLCLHNSKSKAGSSRHENVHAYGLSVNHSSVYFARLSNDNITSSKSWFNKIVSKFSLLGKVRFT